MTPRAASHESIAWLEVRSGAILTRRATGVEVIDDAGIVRGVVGFDDATHTCIRAHMAVDTPVAWRTLLPAAFEYAFRQLGKRVLVGTIPADNEKSLRFARRAGLHETYRIRDGWAEGVAMVVLEMRKEQWAAQREAA